MHSRNLEYQVKIIIVLSKLCDAKSYAIETVSFGDKFSRKRNSILRGTCQSPSNRHTFDC